MTSPTDRARRLVERVAQPLGIQCRNIDVEAPGDPGLSALTGYRTGPPTAVPRGPVDAAAAALAAAEAYSGTVMPGVEVLTARAAAAGYARNAPWSAGGAFQMLRAADGWFGLSLSRPSDVDLVSALVGCDAPGDPWARAAEWLARTPSAAAAARVALLDMPGGPIPTRVPVPRRSGVLVTTGGPRRKVKHPVVVDLTSLWAGPLCAHLLGRTGARVIKIESTHRPDGARSGQPAFFATVHAGHEFRHLDFDHDRDQLHRLIAGADVVLEASRPRALRHLGIQAEAHVRRGAIWISITAYGRDGENSRRIGFGDDVAAAAGLVSWIDDRPVPIGDALADPLAGVHAAAAGTIALCGTRGALVDVSMYDVCVEAH